MLSASVREIVTPLLDGGVVRIRGLCAADHDALVAMFDSASDDNIYRRFFGYSRHLAQSFVECACHNDDDHLALVAEADGRLVGIVDGELVGDDTADVSLFVADDFHRHGVGTTLLRVIADELWARGVKVLTADVLTVNTPMLHVFAHSGFEVATHREGSVVDVRMTLGDDLAGRYEIMPSLD